MASNALFPGRSGSSPHSVQRRPLLRLAALPDHGEQGFILADRHFPDRTLVYNDLGMEWAGKRAAAARTTRDHAARTVEGWPVSGQTNDASSFDLEQRPPAAWQAIDAASGAP